MPKAFLLRRLLKQEWNSREETYSMKGAPQSSQWNIMPPQAESLKFNFQGKNTFGVRAQVREDYMMSNQTEFISSNCKYELQDDIAQNKHLKGSESMRNNPETVSLAKNEKFPTTSTETSEKIRASKNSKRSQQRTNDETRQHREASKRLSTPYGNAASKSPYKCDQCGKIFKTKYTLTIHLKMPTHTGAKPFVCAICGKGFRLSSTLCRHKIIHTSEKPHKCHICHKAFNRSSTLKTHIRTHSELKEFVCDICGKGFHQKGNLRNHVLIHTGEKPYHCNLCDKAFNKLSNLKFHMHIHTDNAPYRCRYCKTCFTRRCDLKLHIAECNQQN